MEYWLLENPNTAGTGLHYYKTRKGGVKGFVIHCTAGPQDRDMEGRDDSVAAELRYLRKRSDPVSFHSISDSDNEVRIIPDSYTGFHCRGYNSNTVGHEICKREMNWKDDPAEWVTATLWQTAKCIAPRVKTLRLPLRKATKAELDRAIARNGLPVGFVGHYQLDPTRRSDPGLVNGVDTFPWKRFFGMIAQINAGGTGEVRKTVTLTDEEERKLMSGIDIVREGDSDGELPGKPVRRTQALLNVWGFTVTEDGEFGPGTHRAVRAFQSANGLEDDGVVGPATLSKLLR